MRQWKKLGLAVLLTGFLFNSVETVRAQTNQNSSSSQQTTNSSQNAIYQISPSVSYQVPIYFLQNHQVNSGMTLNVNGYVGTTFGIKNSAISAPNGYNISKNADQYHLNLNENGYTISRYHNNQWNQYKGKIIISLNAKKVKNTTIVYQNASGKQLKSQKISGYVGYEIKRKYLKLPNGTKIPKNSTWITHYFSVEPQKIIVTVENKETSSNNNTQQNKNKKQKKMSTKSTQKTQTKSNK